MDEVSLDVRVVHKILLRQNVASLTCSKICITAHHQVGISYFALVCGFCLTIQLY